MELNKITEYENRYYPKWVDKIVNSGNVIFIPGLMGSELYDLSSGGGTLWVDITIRSKLGRLAYERLDPFGSVDSNNQCIVANRTTQLLVSDYYDKYLYELGNGCFCFDWRESIALEARRLSQFIRKHLLPQIDKSSKNEGVKIVAHSMGCNLLLRMLSEATDLFDRIDKIIFIGPPFWGALSPLQVIEYGNGTAADPILPDSELRKVVSTMTGVFNMLPAPREYWPNSLPGASGVPIYPVRTEDDLYTTVAWANNENLEMRETILRSSYSNYQSITASIPSIIPKLRERIYVVVGLRGKTPQLARKINGEWFIETVADEPAAKGKSSNAKTYRNGDGTVLTQSSWIPALGIDRYFAWIPDNPMDSHGELPMINEVIEGVRSMLQGRPNNITKAGLEPLSSVANQIDWSRDVGKVNATKSFYSYNERARLRTLFSPQKWDRMGLNPLDQDFNVRDSDLFVATRAAALRVINGGNLRKEASRISVDPTFLRSHLRKLIMPLI